MNKTLLENPESLRWVRLYEVEDEHGVLRHPFKHLRQEPITGGGYRLLCVSIMTLLFQTLLQRELRRTMACQAIDSLALYPESRNCKRPTARRVIDAMEGISRQRLITEEGAPQDLYTDPTPMQHQLFTHFGNDASIYGRKS